MGLLARYFVVGFLSVVFMPFIFFSQAAFSLMDSNVEKQYVR